MAEKVLMKMVDSQKLLMWSQFFTLEPDKVKEYNIISFYISIPDGNVKALEQAYNKVIETNDSLRLRFCRISWRRIRQYVDDYAYEALPVRRLEAREAFDSYLEGIHSHDLPMFAPQLRWAEIVEIAGKDLVLVMRFHHLLIDGYSITLLFNRVTEAYDQYLAGQEPAPKEYSVLRAFAQEARYKSSPRHAEDFRYWLRNFTFQPHYSFPAGRRSQFGECAGQITEIGGDLYHDVKKLCSQLGCSVQSLIMSAAASTTCQLTGKKNFCMYSLTHGRYDVASRNTVGCLMNTVPVFFNLDPQRKIADLVQGDYMNLLEALKHGRLSMSEQTLLSYKEPILHGFNFCHAWLIISVMEFGAAFSRSAYQGNYVLSTNQCHQFYCSILEVPGERIDIGLTYQTRKYTPEQVSAILAILKETLRIFTANPEAVLASSVDLKQGGKKS